MTAKFKAAEFDDRLLFKHHEIVEENTGNYASWSNFEILVEGAKFQHSRDKATIEKLLTIIKGLEDAKWGHQIRWPGDSFHDYLRDKKEAGL